MKRLMVLTLTLVALALPGAAAATAQEAGPTPVPVTDNDMIRVAKQLYCPVCPNTPLDVCETQACQDWRAQIKDQLGQGWSDEQIIAYFVTQYGERVLAEPKRSGFTSFVWLLPVLALLIGALALLQIGRNWMARRAAPATRTASPASAAVTPADIAPEVLAKLEKELREIA
jgi:cytochrome c-type biogenesis protein CcmH